jgi:5-methylcytosine-specific restriction endonuclease McrA
MLHVILGMAHGEICEETGWPSSAVGNVLSRRCKTISGSHDKPRKRKRQFAVGFDIDQIEREFLDGATTYELGEKYGVNHATISKWMRKLGHCRGKWYWNGLFSSEYANKGTKAYVAACEIRRAEKFSKVADKVTYISGNANGAKVRCVRCGHEFTWWNTHWNTKEPCKVCRDQKNEQDKIKRESERAKSRLEHKRQQEAAREWRLSVPFICCECGEPFYSACETAKYCSDICRKKVKNRRKSARQKSRGTSNQYKRRMRIPINESTYSHGITRESVYEKYKGKCCKCGCKTSLSKQWSPQQANVDHVIALDNNGTNTWDNVQLLCSECNTRKGNKGQMRLCLSI